MDIFELSAKKIFALLGLLFLSISIFVISFTILTTDFSIQQLNVDAATNDKIAQEKGKYNKSTITERKKAEEDYIKNDPDLTNNSKKINKAPKEVFDAIVNNTQDPDLLVTYFQEKLKSDRKLMEDKLKVAKETKAKHIADKKIPLAVLKEDDDYIEILSRKLEVNNTLNNDNKSNVSETEDTHTKVLGIYNTPVTRFDPGDLLIKMDYQVPGMQIYIGTGHAAVYNDGAITSRELIESFPCPEATPVPAWWDGAGWSYRKFVPCSAPSVNGIRKDGVQYYRFDRMGDGWAPGNDSSYEFASWVSWSTSTQRNNAAAVARSLVGRPYSNPFSTLFNKWTYSQICSQVAYTSWISNGADLSYWWHPIVSPAIVAQRSTIVASWK